MRLRRRFELTGKRVTVTKSSRQPDTWVTSEPPGNPALKNCGSIGQHFCGPGLAERGSNVFSSIDMTATEKLIIEILFEGVVSQSQRIRQCIIVIKFELFRNTVSPLNTDFANIFLVPESVAEQELAVEGTPYPSHCKERWVRSI